MLGIDYGSDSEEEQQQNVPGQQPSTSQKPNIGSISTKVTRLPTSGTKSSLGLSLPPPKSKKPAPKKIVVELPKLSKHDNNSAGEDEDDRLSEEMPAAKRPKLGNRNKNSSSALLSMLPAPKKATHEVAAAAAAQRVLGGGRPGVTFSSKPTPVQPSLSEDTAQEDKAEEGEGDYELQDENEVRKDTTTSMIPPSMLLKGKGKTSSASSKTSKSTPAVDFFSLGSSTSNKSPPSSSFSESTETPLVSSISAAPKIEEFQPPSPKIDDPYPGYYQIPSGAWRMHDPVYYKTYTDRWARDYERQIRAYEKSSQKGFEGAGVDGENAEEITASSLADAARAAREEKMSITRGAVAETYKPVPKVAVNPTKTAGIARSRHQLHSLLADAFMNREAIEEKIAQGKRNRKEAGNKYGF